MRGGASRMHAGDATSDYKSYLRRIASMVDKQRYMFGHQPSLADFSCYHALWFTKRIAPLAGILDATPSLSAWMDRMADFGNGSVEQFDALAALDVAAQSAPASVEKNVFQDDHGLRSAAR
jgi:glutathione S-transferase